MDPRLLRYYNQELRYLREMGAEFAKEFPKIAGRLGMEGLEVSDPYVERLLEGSAFLAARIQLKLDAEFPQLAQRLLEMVCPNMAAPVPSMLVARLTPTEDPNLLKGFPLPRGTVMLGPASAISATRCEFRTAQDVLLTPLKVAAVEYFLNAADLGLATLPLPERPRSGLRVRLELPSGMAMAKMQLGSLRFYLGGMPEIAHKLHELIVSSCVGVLVGPPGRSAEVSQRLLLNKSVVSQVGLDDKDAMLPVTLRGLAGTRLIREYFAFSQRFMFIDVAGMEPALKRCTGNVVELVLLFSRHVAALEGAVEPDNMSLHCVPAINLFERRAERLQISEAASAYHVVVERTAPTDFEVFDFLSVSGFDDSSEEQEFLPLFAAPQLKPEGTQGYYSTVREPRMASDRSRRDGPRSAYVGSEVFMALVDPREAPFKANLRELSARIRCTNRDLPMFMPVGQAQGQMSLVVSAPTESVDVVAGPSRPQSALREGGIAWRLLGLLSLNYVSLLDEDTEKGATAVRELLSLFALSADVGFKRQIEGIRSLAASPVVRRHPTPGPIAFSRGLEIRVTFDDMSFEGGSATLLGSVLHQYFARHVSMNSFAQTVLVSMDRGEIMRWAPISGARNVL